MARALSLWQGCSPKYLVYGRVGYREQGRKAAESLCESRQAPPGCRSLGSWKPGAPIPLAMY